MKLTRDIKIIGVLLNLRLCWKESEAGEPVKVHFCYKALDSRDQRVDMFLGRSSQPLTVASFGGPPVLFPTTCMYHAYLSSSETDPFSGNYEAVLEPYLIDTMNAAAAQTPASVSQKISTSQQGGPTVFLLWHATPGLSEVVIPAMYRYSTPWATTQVRWAVPQASGTIGRSQNGETSPMAPRPWRCGTPLTFTSPRHSTCQAPLL